MAAARSIGCELAAAGSPCWALPATALGDDLGSMNEPKKGASAVTVHPTIPPSTTGGPRSPSSRRLLLPVPVTHTPPRHARSPASRGSGVRRETIACGDGNTGT